ncbi:MAG: macro domain-containing protein [Candidatus Diapherotrites archaeon]|nr:macro domain-containing protein [Candidatus Diapherotrites archaeon]
MQTETVRADITKLCLEAIVNPANSNITMGGGLAGAILKVGGQEIKNKAQKYIPVKVGKAVITKAGKLPAKYVIHAPTMEKPTEKVSVENTLLAMKAVLECAQKNKIAEIAVPGLGTGTGRVPADKAAEAMVSTAKEFRSKTVKKVVFVAFDQDMHDAFKKAINQADNNYNS